MSVKSLREFSLFEQYQYVKGFQMFHNGVKLRCAACLSLQFLRLNIYIMTYNSFCIQNEKVAWQHQCLWQQNLYPSPLGSKQARLTLAFLFHCVIAVEFDYWIYNRSVQSTACSWQFKGHPWIAKGVAWPFWQLRTRVYMVLKNLVQNSVFCFP